MTTEVRGRDRGQRRWPLCGAALAIAFGSGGALAAFAHVGCGTDVDLGGGDEGGAPGEAAPGDSGISPDAASGQSQDCDPCTATRECRAEVACAEIAPDGGNAFCLGLCGPDGHCEVDEACRTVRTREGTTADACVPLAGACPTAPGPSGSDGAPLERCGLLVGPPLDAGCRSCRYDCQPNGCYGGWWCDTAVRECVRPPKACP